MEISQLLPANAASASSAAKGTQDTPADGADFAKVLKQSGDADYRLATPEQLVRLLPVAHDDARLFVERDGGMDGARAEAVRLCLYLFERDSAVPLLRSG